LMFSIWVLPTLSSTRSGNTLRMLLFT